MTRCLLAAAAALLVLASPATAQQPRTLRAVMHSDLKVLDAADDAQAGKRTVYVRNPDCRPRPEPPSGLAGGKVVKVDRVEWLVIPDHQTASTR